MITIQSYNQTNNRNFLSDINKDNSILIVGRGNNETKLNEIYKPKSIKDMDTIYGDSDLTIAYMDAVRSGAQNVFVINCLKTSDFVDCLDYVSKYNFAYVVPVGIKLSDKYYNAEYDREVYFAEHYLNEFSKYTNSLIIFTDEHASLYEHIDAYLQDMRFKVDAFKDNVNYLLDIHGRNFAFCLNNLQYKNNSNVILAAMLSNTMPGAYPNTIAFGAIFDLDSEDVFDSDIIYFKSNIHTNTSIENLKNFRTKFDANKIITIDRVIKHIERNLDTSFVLGKLYNMYVKILLTDYLDSFFRGLIGTSITDYCIRKVDFIKSNNMTGYIVVNIDIRPINSLEMVSVLLEVR